MPERVLFSDYWNVSLVVPVFNNVSERFTAKNYGPANLLSVVIKVFEKLVNKRIFDHLEKCSLFFWFPLWFLVFLINCRSSESCIGYKC